MYAELEGKAIIDSPSIRAYLLWQDKGCEFETKAHGSLINRSEQKLRTQQKEDENRYYLIVILTIDWMILLAPGDIGSKFQPSRACCHQG